MKKIIAIICIMFIFILTACSPSGDVENPELKVPDGYSLLAMDLPTGVKVDGIGVEFDPHFFSQNLTRNVAGLTEDKWQLFVERVTKMKISKFRVMALPSWLEPENDNSNSGEINWDKLTPNSLEMQSLKKVLDLAQDINADVTLVLWGVPVTKSLAADSFASKPYFMATNHITTKNWVVAPKSEAMEDEFCENFSAYIQYLVVQEGYTCVTEVTPLNEPNWSYQIDSVVDIDSYIRMCDKLDKRFVKDGIRDLVKFNLVDSDREHNIVIEPVADSIADITDLTNAHTYAFGYDTPNQTIIDWTKQDSVLSRSFSEGHFIGEFGSNETVGSTKTKDIATYKRGVLMSRLMLNFFNGGANGMSYWSLSDQYYNSKASYSEMMQTGLWYSAKAEYQSDATVYSLVKEDFQVKKQYYAFSLFTRLIPRNSIITPIITNDNFLAGTSFSFENNQVYAFANGNTDKDFKFAINADEGSKWDIYMYAEESLPDGDKMIEASSTVVAKNLCVSFEIPAHTVVVLKKTA